MNLYERRELYHYIRVRSIVDEQGNLVASQYGKIMGDIRCHFGDHENTRLFVKFVYYLNPEVNDRNVEFDTRRNLFTYTRDDIFNGNFPP